MRGNLRPVDAGRDARKAALDSTFLDTTPQQKTAENCYSTSHVRKGNGEEAEEEEDARGGRGSGKSQSSTLSSKDAGL